MAKKQPPSTTMVALGGLRIKFLQLILTLVGYAYPAYQTFKAVNRSDATKVRFWGVYWIVFATYVCVEWLLDFVLSWLPLYNEAKLLFVICLWYPKTRLALIIYEQFLAPFVSTHEADIDQFGAEMKIKIYDLMGKHASSAKDNLKIYSSKAQVQVKALQDKALERARQASQKRTGDVNYTEQVPQQNPGFIQQTMDNIRGKAE